MLKKISNKLFEIRQKRALLKEKKRLESELAIARKFPQFGDSEEANASEVEVFEGLKGLEKKIKIQLEEIKKALGRMEKGKYGLCENCKEKIEIGRLKAYPAASTCVQCSTEKKK